ncbi:S8 family peptidase [Patescibacteria group bacterium]|nr:S8 family peptidase [Patescibacteria group bacterium]MCL5797809.1 S8 family peptidase [Patescibacteria group bacterium]
MRKLPLFLFAFLYCLLVFLFFPAKLTALELPSPPNLHGQTDSVIIKYKRNLSLDERLSVHRLIRVQSIKGNIARLGAEAVRLSSGQTPEKAIGLLDKDPRVAYAEPDYKVYTAEDTNDPGILQGLQWGMYKINAAGTGISAWNLAKSSPSVEIAIVDTGIDQSNEDLKGKIVANHNCTDSPTADDLFGHGTHVAGIAASETNNGVGVAGVGYKASLINAKALGDDGSGYYSWLANCIIWSADNGANVINMSLGGPYSSQTLEDAVNYAWNKGVVIVAAAGNSNSPYPFYPAYYSHVIAVAATDINDYRASFSNYGRWIAVAAPGVSIYSTLPDHPNAIGVENYGYLSGTSMASPHVAGLAGLLFGINGMTNTQAVNDIENGADYIPGTGFYWQYGRIDALASVQEALNNQISVPTVTPIPTATPTLKPSPTPTLTPTPKPTSTPVPTPTSPSGVTPTPTPYNPFARWCARFPIFCNGKF